MEPQRKPHASRLTHGAGWRWTGYAVLAGVLAVAFWRYTTPEMMLDWETLLALCGF